MITGLLRKLPRQGRYFSNVASENTAKQMIDSVSTTISGIFHINYIEEFEPNLSVAEKAEKKRFLIYRSNPGDPNDQPKFMSYYVSVTPTTRMYLDILIKIKDEMDSTLSFRRSCREGICGSCSMNLDGLHGLA